MTRHNFSPEQLIAKKPGSRSRRIDGDTRHSPADMTQRVAVYSQRLRQIGKSAQRH
jgi:hypothetical protein